MIWTNAKLMEEMAAGDDVVVSGTLGRIIGIKPESGGKNNKQWLVTMSYINAYKKYHVVEVYVKTTE